MIDALVLFNKKMMEFIDDLILLCPELKDFKILKTASTLMMMTDKDFVRTVFNWGVTAPFEQNILDRNEVFFLQQSFNAYTPYLQQYGNDLNVIKALKTIWADLGSENKEAVWRYLQVLVILDKRCIQTATKST